MKWTLLLIALTCASRTYAAGLFHQPAVSKNHVAFIYNGELWVAPRRGGAATRLTDSASKKFDPRFSPDGKTLAFSNIDSSQSVNIYTMPVTGGTPSRVTWLPSHQNLCQWTDDGRLLFFTNAQSFIRLEMQLFTVSPRGELPVKLPLAFGSDGAIDSTGEWLAYTPQWPSNLTAFWKRYRGGAAFDIHLVHLPTRQSQKITDWPGADVRPMWHGRTIYYVSDAGDGQRLNIWAYDTTTRARRQVTHFTEHDVLSPSIGSGAIVFQLGADLHLLDLKTGKSSVVSIDIPVALRPSATREIDAAKFIAARQLAAGGQELLLEARGDLWVATASSARNLTETSGAFEREASVSPDAKSVAYFSDATGEYELYVRDLTSSAPARQLTRAGAGFRYRPVWAPDAKRLAFADHNGRVFIADVADLEITEIDHDPWGELVELAWSADSHSLVYSRTAKNRLGVLWLYDLTTREKRQLTSEMFYASMPAFDRGGRYLFFVSYRHFGTPAVDFLSQRIAHRALNVVLAVPMSAIAAAKSVDDVERAAIRLGTATGAITSLAATHNGNAVYGFTDGNAAQSVRLYDVDAKKEQVLVEGTSGFDLAAGRHLLIAKDGAYTVRDLDAPASTDTAIATSGMKATIDLAAERREIFEDAWRRFRDFFFAPKVAGTFDWNDVRRRYAPLVQRAGTRDDLNWILSHMIGEVSVGHAYVGNRGDVGPPSPGDTVGMLGADYALENGAYRIVRIHQPAASDERVRSPLTGVREGEYLLAVDGKPLDVRKDPRTAFVGLVGKPVTIRVGPNPVSDANTREVVVTPIANEGDLRGRAWVERNRAYVERASGGRIGYVRIPDFTTSGFNEFVRNLSGQTAKDALIFDPRWAQGGWIGGLAAEALARRPLNYAAARGSEEVWPTPRWGAHFGPKSVLLNHLVVSAGENFAHYFRKMELGPLIGSRTWGGLTGLNGAPLLLDGGEVNVPNAPFFDESGWLIEGHGIDPDVIVEDDPARRTEFDPDPQLVTAVQAMLEALKTNAAPLIRHPATFSPLRRGEGYSRTPPM
ncbi:MAG TPA: S41 family peptidase [Thermoanaerobaculia bacterium]|nr:S41 family peptidase [Thermoanaerobaculia bacterium]